MSKHMSWLTPVLLFVALWACCWSCMEMVRGPVTGWAHLVQRALCTGLLTSLLALGVAMVWAARGER